jgi:hypothetical protein
MVSVFTLNAVDHWFEARSGQTKDYVYRIIVLGTDHLTFRKVMFFPMSKNYFLHETKIRFVLHEKSVFFFLQIFKDFLLQTA